MEKYGADEDDDHWVDKSLGGWDPHKMKFEAQQRSAGGPLGGGMGMDTAEIQRIRSMVEVFTTVLTWVGYVIAVAAVLFALKLAFRVISNVGPDAVRYTKTQIRRKHANFERAAFFAIVSIGVPIMIAQIGLLSGPLLPPHVGWKIYVYGSCTSGAAAAILGGLALARGERSTQTRAVISFVIGVVVLGLVYTSTRVAPAAHGLPRCNDVTTDGDAPPLFAQLADAHHPARYPPAFIPVMREHSDLIAPKFTSLPIGAAFIRSLHLAKESHWHVVTNLTYTDGTSDGSGGGYLEPSVWMDKTDIFFEATDTTPLFRIPDEIIVRVRTYTFDDGYVGSRVDVRSRGHRQHDRGSNALRVKKFVQNEDW